MPSTASRVIRSIALLGALLAPIAVAAAPQQNEATEHMRQGMTLIQEGKAAEALVEFQKALEISPDLAGAHFYAGMALGQLQRFDESLEHFLAAEELDPGNPQVYVMGLRTAYALKDYDEAWNQGILAAQAGEDMSQAFAGLEQISSRPDDFDARMSTPHVLVPELDLTRVTAADATPDSTMGSSMDIASRTEDFREARRQLALSLVRSDAFSVTQSREQANYVLLVEIDALTATASTGMMKLIDAKTNEVAMSRPVSLPNSVSGQRSVADRLVGYLEEWAAKR